MCWSTLETGWRSCGQRRNGWAMSEWSMEFSVSRCLGIPGSICCLPTTWTSSNQWGKTDTCTFNHDAKKQFQFLMHISCLIVLIFTWIIFLDAQWYTNARFGKGHGTPTLTTWRCFGNESFLADCLYQSDGFCYQSEVVGVSCQGEEVKGLLNTFLANTKIYEFFIMISKYISLI